MTNGKGYEVGNERLFTWIFPLLLVPSLAALLASGPVSCGGLVLQLPSEAGTDAAGAEGGIFVSLPPASTGLCGTTGRGSCKEEGLVCEIGLDPASACNTLTICDGGTLKPLAVVDTHCPTVDNGVGASCPGYEAKGTAGDGGEICTFGATCDYAQGRCQCSVVSPERSPSWHCEDPGSACPPVRPRLGQPCTQEGQHCNYDACGVTPSFGSEACDGGVWIAAEPPSCSN